MFSLDDDTLDSLLGSCDQFFIDLHDKLVEDKDFSPGTFRCAKQTLIGLGLLEKNILDISDDNLSEIVNRVSGL